jgi:hypothetical protein
MPQQIYWNVQGGTVGFPVQADTPNTQMISGFSADLLKLVLEDRTSDFKEKPPPTPWDTFCKAVDDPRYDEVCRVIEKTREAGVFSNYTAPVRLDESSIDEESKDPDASSTASADETWDTCGDVVHEAVSKKCWSSSQVSEWLSSLGYTDATVEAILHESVDGAVMQSVVESQDRSALEELYVTKRLGQTRIFTEWLKA